MKLNKLSIACDVFLLFFIWAIFAVNILVKPEKALLYLLVLLPVTFLCYNSIKQALIKENIEQLRKKCKMYYLDKSYTIDKWNTECEKTTTKDLVIYSICYTSITIFAWSYYLFFANSNFYLVMLVPTNILAIFCIAETFYEIKKLRAKKNNQPKENQYDH